MGGDELRRPSARTFGSGRYSRRAVCCAPCAITAYEGAPSSPASWLASTRRLRQTSPATPPPQSGRRPRRRWTASRKPGSCAGQVWRASVCWRLRIPEASLPLLAAPAAPHGTCAGRLAAMVPRGRCGGCDRSCVKRDGWGGGARGHESEADEAVEHDELAARCNEGVLIAQLRGEN